MEPEDWALYLGFSSRIHATLGMSPVSLNLVSISVKWAHSLTIPQVYSEDPLWKYVKGLVNSNKLFNISCSLPIE